MIPFQVIEGELKEMVEISADKEIVQIVSIMGLVILGSVAMIYDGDVGETIALAVAGCLGLMGGSIFRVLKDKVVK